VSDAVARVGLTAAPIGMTDRTVAGIREVLGGGRRWRSPLLFAGPAVVASIAHMDPGNFADNIQAQTGARQDFREAAAARSAAARDGGLNFED
jgi:hypothetical protein